MNNILSQIHRIDFKPSYNLGDLIDISLPAKPKHNDSDALLEFRSVLEQHTSSNKMEIGKNYKITVKQYMTEKSTRNFDFMLKWNNDIPMPLCIMQGELVKETRGMYYMKLKGNAEPSCRCFVCGRTLSNPASKLYGIGPECSEKIGLIRIDTEDEAREKWNEISAHLQDISWEGWVIKSAVKEWELLDENL